MSKKSISKETMINDLQKIIKKYQKEFPDSKQSITRDYYRKHGKFNNEYDEIFGSFNIINPYCQKTFEIIRIY